MKKNFFRMGYSVAVPFNQGAPKAREGKRPVQRIVLMFDANSKRGALIRG